MPQAFQTRLHKVAKNGEKEALQFHLETGLNNVNVRNSHRETPLMLAATNGHSSCVQVLIEYGASVQLVDDHGRNVLHKMAMRAHLGDDAWTVGYVLAQGININATDNYGLTALQYSARNGHWPIVESLVQANASLYHRNENGETALNEAVKNGHGYIAEIFINGGMNLNLQNNSGKQQQNNLRIHYSHLNFFLQVRLSFSMLLDVETKK